MTKRDDLVLLWQDESGEHFATWKFTDVPTAEDMKRACEFLLIARHRKVEDHEQQG